LTPADLKVGGPVPGRPH